MKFTTYDTMRFVDAWEVRDKPHCSNCSNCKVMGSPLNPDSYCAMGHGPASISLGAVIRTIRPRQFEPAQRCPDFDDMGPACLPSFVRGAV